MGIIKNRWLTTVSLIIVLFVVTACFQQVGDEAQGQAVSIQITDTPLPPPTLTPEPTDEPTAADLPISNNPTATETATATDTATPFAVAQAGGTATVDPNDFSLRATQLIEEATGTAAAPLTQTAAVIIGFTDTPTPTLVPVNNTGTINNFNSGIDCVHEVRTGETMYSYSRYYGVSVADIATRNGIVNPNIISIGQMLTIPGCGTNGVLPPPTSVPTATVTPFQLNTFGQGGNEQNTDASLGQGGGIATNVACITQYTVQQYDTLFQISITHGVPVQSIANANAILNLGRIDMGDVLCIPAQ